MQEGPLESQGSLKAEKGGQGVAMREGLQSPVLASKMERGSTSQKKRGLKKLIGKHKKRVESPFIGSRKHLDFNPGRPIGDF